MGSLTTFSSGQVVRFVVKFLNFVSLQDFFTYLYLNLWLISIDMANLDILEKK